MTRTLLAFLTVAFLIALPAAATTPEDSDVGTETTAGAIPGSAEDQSRADADDATRADLDTDLDGDKDLSADVDADKSGVSASVTKDTDTGTKSFDASAGVTSSDELPRTASPLPLLALSGIASLFGAATLGRARKQ